MIEPNSIVAVGVSGGKDSLAMLCTLAAFRNFGVIPFKLIAITVDMGFEKIGVNIGKEVIVKKPKLQ